MKKCNTCNKNKPIKEYYKHKTTKDRLFSMCKKCHLEKKAEERKLNPKKFRDRENKYRENNPEGRKNYLREKLQNDPEFRKKSMDHAKDWAKKNREKSAAHSRLYYAIQMGYIIKPKECEVCKKSDKLIGHHEDITAPPKPIFLCESCKHYYELGVTLSADKIRIKVKELYKQKYLKGGESREQ